MGSVRLFKKIKKLSPNNDYKTNNIRFAKYYVFMFLLYNIINQHYSSLNYYLLTKMHFYKKLIPK